ncbi:hypothetical protein [Cupriavidus cauae]|uniref:Uncharacterized protein n=1 Tax=Cupriavidus cauae TaxID=2608999 RepID=A0A5M8ALR1_9BURK|nr:hypothetical protein [Cupriavidus cauae]KAA6123121.1 hypothetical protein F1599_14675 [Cupriavidus cauae]
METFQCVLHYLQEYFPLFFPSDSTIMSVTCLSIKIDSTSYTLDHGKNSLSSKLLRQLEQEKVRSFWKPHRTERLCNRPSMAFAAKGGTVFVPSFAMRIQSSTEPASNWQGA